MSFWARGAFAPGYFTPGYYGPEGGGVEPPIEMPHPVGGAPLARPKTRAKRFTRRLEIVAAVEIDRAFPLDVLRILVAERSDSLQLAVTPPVAWRAALETVDESDRALELAVTRQVWSEVASSDEVADGACRWVVESDSARETEYASGGDDNGENS